MAERDRHTLKTVRSSKTNLNLLRSDLEALLDGATHSREGIIRGLSERT